MSDKFTRFLQELINHEMQKVEIGFTAKIISFDKEKMRAEIQPLLRSKTEEDGRDNPKFLDISNIDDVPVELIFAGGCYIRPEYKKNDLVKCSLSASSIDQPINSDKRADMLENRFQLNYCTVTGAVVPENFSVPSTWGALDGLLIGKGDNTVLQVIDGKFVVDGDFEIDGDFEASGSLTVGSLSATNDITVLQGNINVVEGDIVAVAGDVIAGTISLKTHVHQVTGVGSPTGPPQ